jgi:hypothetical protein
VVVFIAGSEQDNAATSGGDSVYAAIVRFIAHLARRLNRKIIQVRKRNVIVAED